MLTYLFSSVHQGCSAVFLSSIHPHPLLYQQPEDVVLPPRCCQHAQGHTTDVLWTERQIQSCSVTKECFKMTSFSLTCFGLLIKSLSCVIAEGGESLKPWNKHFSKKFFFLSFWASEDKVMPFCNHIDILFSDKVYTGPGHRVKQHCGVCDDTFPLQCYNGRQNPQVFILYTSTRAPLKLQYVNFCVELLLSKALVIHQQSPFVTRLRAIMQ